ncbi:MAG: hypothetical protein S4CHLAM37_13310 [Chlamydiia bacterium]|nr:hypothetical protein [Chlamydiia bacterium]
MKPFLNRTLGILTPNAKVFTIVLLSVFILFFPKGGVKILNLPITWGFFFLMLSAFRASISSNHYLQKRNGYVLIALLPFQATSLISILVNGYTNTGYTLSLFLNFFIFPYIFLGVFPKYLDTKSYSLLLKWIKQGTFFVAIYGIFLFCYKLFTGSFFEIPFLTINFHDRNELEAIKCIDRGGIFKLISTYNNGNLYGICMLMLLPLYNLQEHSRFKRISVKLSLILTLSRTIWAGLLFVEILQLLISSYNPIRKIVRITILFVTGIALYLCLQFIFPFSHEFLFDRFLGTRIGQFEVLKTATWFSSHPFEEVFEIVYLGIIKGFGFLGLIAYLVGMLSPIVLGLATKEKLSNPDKSIILGLTSYLFISFGDGALLLIPVMCFYWILTMLLTHFPNNTHSFENKRKKVTINS